MLSLTVLGYSPTVWTLVTETKQLESVQRPAAIKIHNELLPESLQSGAMLQELNCESLASCHKADALVGDCSIKSTMDW